MIDDVPWYVRPDNTLSRESEVLDELRSLGSLAFSGQLFHPAMNVVLVDVAEMPIERLRAVQSYLDFVEQIDRRPTVIAPSHERYRASAALSMGSNLILPMPAQNCQDMRWLRWSVLKRKVAGCKGAEFSGDRWLRRMILSGRQSTIDRIDAWEAKLASTLALMRPGPMVGGVQMGLMSLTTQVAKEFAAYRQQSGIRSGLSPAAWALSCLQYSVAPPPEEVERWRMSWFDGDRSDRRIFPSSHWIGRSGQDAEAEGRGTIDVMINPQRAHSDTICMDQRKRGTFLENLIIWFEGELCKLV